MNILTKTTTMFSFALVALLLPFQVSAHCGACGTGESASSSSKATHKVSHKHNIVDTAASNEEFSTLVTAVKAAGLADTLSQDGPFTVFAPTNDAFSKLSKDALNDLLKPENKEKLAGILKYHVVSGKVMAKDVVKMDSAETVQGQKVKIKVADGTVYVNDAKVIKADIKTQNGVIHVIDSVIMPEAKTDKKDIVDTAKSAGDFTTLVAAVQAAGLTDTLKGEGPFTVFAPTDEAFAKLPEGTVANLIKPENKDQLAKILKYHVVSGKVKSDDVIKLSEAKTVEGQNISIKVRDGKVFVNNAEVVTTDIETSNGVIHVIDNVIVPN